MKSVDLHEHAQTSNASSKGSDEKLKFSERRFSNTVVDTLISLKLNVKYCVAVSTDGYTVMVSERCGTVL